MKIHNNVKNKYICLFFLPIEAHREGDGQVNLSSDIGHIPLPEETRQADLGAIWRERKNVSQIH